MVNRNLVESFKVVQGIQPRTTNAGFNSDWVSLKNANKAYIVVNLTQAVGHATAFTLAQATAVAGTGTKATTGNAKIWANEDCAATDKLVRQADGKAFTVQDDIKNKMIIFEIDPAVAMDVEGDFDCIGLTVANSGQANNIASVEFLLDMKYKEATPPSAIID
jgi:hypothetical protein